MTEPDHIAPAETASANALMGDTVTPMSSSAGSEAIVTPANAEAAEAFEKRVMRKVSWRLLPFIFLLYMLNILDRSNVGMAALEMGEGLGLDKKAFEAVFAQAAGIFTVGYVLFEVPSNLLLGMVGARRWISRIMISWGLATTGMMFVTSPLGFYIARFLLGVAEAGFFPGIILYLSYWFPARERARAVSRFMTASALTGVFGNLLSGAILQYMDGAAGLAGWRWMFLLEGAPSVVVGFLVLRYLTDRPEQASWLEPAERRWLGARMKGEEAHRVTRHGLTLLRALVDWRVWLLCGLYFTVSTASYSFGYYSPKMVKAAFPAADPFMVGALTMLPNITGVLAMLVVGWHSDRTGERRLHIAGSALVSAAGWTLIALSGTSWLAASALGFCAPWLTIFGLALAQAGIMSMLAPFWTLPTSFLSGAAAAGGLAFINSVGNLGGVAGPTILGIASLRSDSYVGGQLLIAGLLVVGAVIAACARHDPSLDHASSAT